MPPKIPFSVIKEKAIIKHNGFYTYDNIVNYNTQKDRYQITCPIHGDFPQRFDQHLEGQGCPDCGRTKQGGFDMTQFKIDGTRVHNGFYDYSESVYNDRHVTMKCPVHGEINPRVDAHLNGSICMKCSKEKEADRRRLSVEEIKDKFYALWGDRYDMSLITEVKLEKKPKYDLICKKHGIFHKRTDLRSTDGGCSQCSAEAKLLDESVVMQRNIEQHGDIYDYSLYNYTGMDETVKIICKVHGVFKKSAYNHMMGVGCPDCSPVSQEEINLQNFLSEYVGIERNNKTILKNRAELDVFIPSLNLAVEYNGVYFHSDKFQKPDYHLNKTTQCQAKDIKLIHIFEDEWLQKKEVVKSRLLELISESPTYVAAKDCEIKTITIRQANEFLKVNNLTEDSKLEWGLGLYHKEELVQLMTVRNNWNNNWEILRFCNKLNTYILGGHYSLLDYFQNNYDWNEITAEVDLRWDNGDLYKSLGFELESQTEPNYFYTKGRNRQTEYEEGMHKIYNCGTLKFRKVNQK